LQGEPDIDDCRRQNRDLHRQYERLGNLRLFGHGGLVEFLHESLPERKDPNGFVHSHSAEEILQALGKSDDEIRDAREHAKEHAQSEALFGRK
jgi:hypothetical protein